MEGADFRSIKITDLAFRDPLTDNTRRTRTHLLFVSVLSILVEVYRLRVTRTPWLDIEIPAHAPQLLQGVLSAALIYLFVVFALYAWQDYRRWRVAGEITLVQSAFNLILQSKNDLFTLKQLEDKLNSTLSLPLEASFLSAIETAATRIPTTQAQIQDLYRNYQVLSILQWFRLLVVEIGIPIVVGLVAVAHVGHSLIPFLRSVIL